MIDFSSVKLVVSDMDGTLLNTKNEVSNRFFKLFKELQKHNIHFCAASGRQYNSIISKLKIIKNDIFVIAENGGIAKQGDKVLMSNYLAADKVLQLIPVLRKIKGANMVLCAEDNAYIESKDPRFILLFQEYYSSFKMVDDLVETAKNTALFKVAVYHFDSSEEYIYPVLRDFKYDVLLKVSGKNWLDISDEKANKGNALRTVQQLLNVTKEETMVFGDYFNDVEMMQEATFSYAMENAHPDIKKIANFSTDNNDNFGVENVLEKLIDSRK